jgi:hypothetical protein
MNPVISKYLESNNINDILIGIELLCKENITPEEFTDAWYKIPESPPDEENIFNKTFFDIKVKFINKYNLDEKSWENLIGRQAEIYLENNKI